MKPTLYALSVLLPLTLSAVVHADIATPKAGSPERKAIMDALRPTMKDHTSQEPTFYDVEVKTENGWAFVQANPKDAKGEQNLLSGKLVIALLKKEGTAWRVLHSEYIDANDSANKRVAILRNYPNAPALLLGGYAARWGYGTFSSVPYSGADLTDTDKHDLLNVDQTFLTLGLREFPRGKIFTNAELIGLGTWMAMGDKPASESQQPLRVSAQEVDTALAKYLPQRITKHGVGDTKWDPATRMYTLIASDGLEGELTALSSVRKNSDGTYRAVIATVDAATGKPTGWRHLIFKRVPGKSNTFPALEWATGR